MPPCVVRPVGPPARAGEHSKPSCLQARAVRARRSDVLGFEGGAQPQAPEELPQGKGVPRLFVPGRLPPACSFILFFGRSCGPGIWMPRPAHHPSIHPSIHPGLPLLHSSPPPSFPCQSLMYSCPSPCCARHAPIFVMHAHMPCAIRWRSPCDTRFAPPHHSRPVRRLQWGVPCPTQVAGTGHAQGPAAQWWWAHGGPAGVIGGKNCTNGK